jgi:1-acyl-sn-glycerol-3-phosphate acyltransferase
VTASRLTIEKAGMPDRLAGVDEVERQPGAGDLLVIFGEGTFARGPGLLPCRLGTLRAAVTRRPIVPVALAGTRRVFPVGTWLLRHAPITVTIGSPIDAQGTGWPEMVRLRDAAVDQSARECRASTLAPVVR